LIELLVVSRPDEMTRKGLRGNQGASDGNLREDPSAELDEEPGNHAKQHDQQQHEQQQHEQPQVGRRRVVSVTWSVI
jgi:hypothetical protein